MRANREYRIVTNGHGYRVQWRPRGGWILGLWSWPWSWLSHEINCGFAGTDYEPTDFATFAEADAARAAAIADNIRRDEREQWRVVLWASDQATDAVDPHAGGTTE